MRVCRAFGVVLCLLVCAPPAQAGILDGVGGKYRVTGNNPIYGDYTGSVEVVKRGSAFDFFWHYEKAPAYEGSGKASGKKLVVEWGLPGQKKLGTVTYTLGAGGVLRGDVRMFDKPSYRGNEMLTPEGKSHLDLVGGSYRVNGLNPIYGKFSGTANVRRDGSSFHFFWHYQGIADYDGDGMASGTNRITVEWGVPDQPRLGKVVYTVSSDGSLKGAVTMFSNPSYKGNETLTPDR